MSRKICFVSLGATSFFFKNKQITYIGGAELKQVLIGRELTKQGYDISFIIYDIKGERKNDLDKIILIGSFPQTKNLSLVRKAMNLWKSLKKANSEIYIQSGGTPGTVALYCLVTGKRYVKWLASDRNVHLTGVDNKTSLMMKIAMYFDIKFAHLIIAQNTYQKKIIEKKFQKSCVLIKNPVPGQKTKINSKKDKKTVLWVGTIRSIKQPEVFLEVAKKLPEYSFVMIGGSSDTEPDLYDQIKKGTQKIPNLEFLGFIPYHEMKKYYAESCIVVNTSKIEGFPNIFLEAWINYTPVVSLNVDPDEIICKYNLGFHSKTFDKMIQDITTLLRDESLRKKLGKSSADYVKKEHNINNITKNFVSMFEKYFS
ncbi:MAG: glycosyltransferase [Candidatus Lokiarchaeota archaeon]|nr:glycosyltransferase [Candidatus Lokiarchaeota archaeon]